VTPMNADVRPIKTAAEQTLARSFAAAKADPARAAALRASRDAAFQRFEALGLPHRRVEQWKYTDLRALMREANPLAGPPDAMARERASQAGRALAAIGARRLVFVDGRFVPDLSDTSELEPGLTITSLAEALARGEPDVVARLGAPSLADGDPAFALNTAFMGDGAVIGVADGARIERPIHLVFAYAGDAPAAVFSRSLVILGHGASLTLAESHEGFGGGDYQVNSALDLALGDEAALDHVRLGLDGERTLHVSTLAATVGRAARLRDIALTAGGAVARNQLFVRCAGPGAEIDLSGLALLSGSQHADSTLVLDHAAGGCRSRELFKSVLDGGSRSVFQGKIVVRPGAQKTDARMMTRALLLSETAEADSKPELEIFADDVQCGHGSTTGALDGELKFYLMARGVPETEAETLLIQAFAGEVLDGIAHGGVREALTRVMIAKLAPRPEHQSPATGGPMFEKTR